MANSDDVAVESGPDGRWGDPENAGFIIEQVEARALRVPLRVPTDFSTRTVDRREYVVTLLRSRNGCYGEGYTYAGTSGGAWVRDAINNLIAPVLRGRNALARESNWDAVFRELLLVGRGGGLLRALSAVDIAAWDLLGRSSGLPLRVLLGGEARRVEAYASGGYYRPGDPIENVVTEIARYKAHGFKDFKIKVGGLRLAEDVKRVAAARESIGPDGRIALDANNAWRYVADALRAADAFAEFDIWWLEEPLMPDDIAGHAALVRQARVPIATGEIEGTRWGFGRLIRADAAHILQPDACVCGGVTEWRRIALAASAFDLPVASHWHANLHAQLAPTVTNALPVEYFGLDEDIYNFERLLTNPLRIEDGAIMLGSSPGIGVEFDPDALAEFTVG